MPIPLRGDRSAWDDIDYPGLHSRDLDSVTPIHHLPFLPDENDIPIWDGSKWIKITLALASLLDVDLTSLDDGYGLVYDLGSAKWVAQLISSGSEISSLVHQHICQEDHSSECNGVTIEFATDYPFAPTTTHVWLNGLIQSPVSDYVESAGLNAITMSIAPLANDNLMVAYIYTSGSPVPEPPPPPPPPPPIELVPEGPYVVGDQDVVLIMNGHGHTNQSDGSLTPALYATTYEAQGHDCLVMTDHNVVTADPGGHGLVYILANEITSSNGHIVSLGSTYDPASGTNSQTVIDSIEALSGVSILAHPNWTTGWSDSEFSSFSGYTGIEIFNMHVETGVSSNGVSNPGFATTDWDFILTNVSRNVFAFAGDDYHSSSSYKFYNSGRLVVFADGSSGSDVITAIRAGNFATDVSNYGVTPAVPVVNGNGVSLACAGATSIRFIDSVGLLEEDSGSSGSYGFSGTEDYVRIEVVGDYTEPFSDSLNDRWSAYDGTWTTGSGTLNMGPDTSTRMLFLRRYREGDFQAQFDAKVGGTSSSRAFGLVFNAVDASRFYLLRFGRSSGVASWSNKFAFGYSNPSFYAPFAYVDAVPDDNTWYTIKCEYIYSTGTFKAKYWKRDSESEPENWAIEYQSTVWKHGFFGFRALGTLNFDNLYINGFKTYYQPLPIADWEEA